MGERGARLVMRGGGGEAQSGRGDGSAWVEVGLRWCMSKSLRFVASPLRFLRAAHTTPVQGNASSSRFMGSAVCKNHEQYECHIIHTCFVIS